MDLNQLLIQVLDHYSMMIFILLIYVAILQLGMLKYLMMLLVKNGVVTVHVLQNAHHLMNIKHILKVMMYHLW